MAAESVGSSLDCWVSGNGHAEDAFRGAVNTDDAVDFVVVEGGYGGILSLDGGACRRYERVAPEVLRAPCRRGTNFFLKPVEKEGR
jgi:hypothetical protein